MMLKTSHLKLIDQTKHTVISLIPNSGLQFLDYETPSNGAEKLSQRFHDEHLPDQEERGLIVKRIVVHPMVQERLAADDDFIDPEDETCRSVLPNGPSGVNKMVDTYEVTAKEAMNVFNRQWLPIPVFNSKETVPGPTSWAQVYFAKGENGNDHKIVLAFDTEVCVNGDGKEYAGISPLDVADVMEFKLISDIADQLSYAGGKWQRRWIQESYLEGLKTIRPRGASEADFASAGVPWAHYAMFLQALKQMLNLPTITLTNIMQIEKESRELGRQAELSHLDVDLVLDVGNSRCCGILVEKGVEGEAVGLGQPPTRLEIRDFSRPERVTSEPFDSRVEFQTAKIGRNYPSRKIVNQRQKRPFQWPSPLRVGPEAVWLSSLTDGRDGRSGMSSPKRYVWDRTKRPQSWVNNRAGRPADATVPAIVSSVSAKLSTTGRPLADGESVAAGKQYSRSSMYMLMLTEIFCHALSQINSPSYRLKHANSNLPRRLTNIFITLPSATPIAEQKAMEAHARRAIKLLWSALEWSDDWLHPTPRLHLNWDEATATQLVFMYNELEHKFQSFPKHFFNVYGRDTDSAGNVEKLRIASLDIGGGTTDLMIIEHSLFDEIITPNQLFREGYRQAGDDILKEIIEKSILPRIAQVAAVCGAPHAKSLISSLFDGDRTDISRPDQIRRGLFATQVLIPAALKLMQEYEKTDSRFVSQPVEFTFGDLGNLDTINSETSTYVDRAVHENGGDGFAIAEVKLVMDAREIAGAINAVLGRVLEDVADAVRAYDCDILLLTGRPAGLPAVREILMAQAPVAPERFIPMYGYRVGNWYPFRATDSRIWDSKTTAAVGALLCHLCQGKHASFVFEAGKLNMKSTAKYIGKMDQQGRISADDVFFENLSDSDDTEQEFETRMGSRLDIGYRQLPIERWVTSQLYTVQYYSDEVAIRTPKPVTVRMRRQKPSSSHEPNELDKEQFEIVEAYDAEERPCKDSLVARLQTVRTIDQSEAGYWLDTGVLSTSHMTG